MFPGLNLIRGIITAVTWICGTILNLSVVAVFLRDWKNKINLAVGDQIILTIGWTNLLSQSFCALDFICVTYGFYILLPKEFSLGVFVVIIFLNCLLFWLIASLSICYCLKLVNLSHEIWSDMKRRILNAIPLLLLGSGIISFAISLPFVWKTEIKDDKNTTDHLNDYLFIFNKPFSCINITFGCGLPSVITSCCIGLSIKSLLKHIWRMKKNISQFWSPQTKNHLTACRTMFLLLVINLFLFFVYTLNILIFSYSPDPLNETVLWSLIMLNPSGQAIVLILGNSKLANMWSKIWLTLLGLGHTSAF
ncbi:hypothetical protein GDO86_017613 [Hymenochirus boettgeri]|uniref:Taste receptor type 2 n=1 Tax=Hymenochirus boettgeri TaxID=247094 RepID=A0A8T2IBS5_9PIPI|nr:hypothetical protein GDO86_020497 [Hymenochirus boettgeri]KAG8430495.1 hypothetical protein GDO86_020498 [Hymenochirus boettgeri]KAG8433397.1 hypothetical protein GDO86_017613 [Hymenochirus boettgeri]